MNAECEIDQLMWTSHESTDPLKSKFNKNAGSRLHTHATSLASLLQPSATKTDIVGQTVGLVVVFNAQINIRSNVQSIAG